MGPMSSASGDGDSFYTVAVGTGCRVMEMRGGVRLSRMDCELGQEVSNSSRQRDVGVDHGQGGVPGRAAGQEVREFHLLIGSSEAVTLHWGLAVLLVEGPVVTLRASPLASEALTWKIPRRAQLGAEGPCLAPVGSPRRRSRESSAAGAVAETAARVAGVANDALPRPSGSTYKQPSGRDPTQPRSCQVRIIV